MTFSKGRNPQGKVGLFPKSFAAPAPSFADPLYSNVSPSLPSPANLSNLQIYLRKRNRVARSTTRTIQARRKVQNTRDTQTTRNNTQGTRFNHMLMRLMNTQSKGNIQRTRNNHRSNNTQLTRNAQSTRKSRTMRSTTRIIQTTVGG